MIQVLQKAGRILGLIANNDQGITFTAISRELGINKATLSHILSTLTDMGYTEKETDGNYIIGEEIVGLAGSRLRRKTLAGLAEQFARELAMTLQENVTIGALYDGERYNLATAEANQNITVSSRVGLRPSPYETATGRMLLAGLSEKELEMVVEKKGLPNQSWAEVKDLNELKASLKKIRAEGIAETMTSDGQVQSVAVPVFGADNSVWVSIGASIPEYRSDRERKAYICKELSSAAERMQAILKTQF